MFDRIVCKQIAKKQLQNRWLVPVLITALIALISIAFNLPDIIAHTTGTARHMANGYSFQMEWQQAPGYRILQFVALFVMAIVNQAYVYYYLIMSRTTEKVAFSHFVQGFSLWGKALLNFLWTSLWTFLWSLLFVIPGIVKTFAYSMSPFILAEYPQISVPKAMRLSMALTKGYKGELFVLGLSFIGWMILATIPACLGWLWLAPYMEMTWTNAYHMLKKHALDSGAVVPEDFN